MAKQTILLILLKNLFSFHMILATKKAPYGTLLMADGVGFEPTLDG